MCFYSSQNKQQFISLYNINVLVFISEKCLLRGTDWIFKYNCGLYESVTVSECWGPRSILGRSMCGGQCRCGISFSSSTLVLTCQYLWFSPVGIFGSRLSVSLVLTCIFPLIRHHHHLHPHVALTEMTNGQSLGTFQTAMFVQKLGRTR